MDEPHCMTGGVAHCSCLLTSIIYAFTNHSKENICNNGLVLLADWEKIEFFDLMNFLASCYVTQHLYEQGYVCINWNSLTNDELKNVHKKIILTNHAIIAEEGNAKNWKTSICCFSLPSASLSWVSHVSYCNRLCSKGSCTM